MNRNSSVSSSVVMCWPSTSASAIRMILWYRSLLMSKSSWMPVPSAVISDCTSVFFSTRSMRAFSTLMILPRIGRIAWNMESRHDLAEPPAESPSTMYSSLSAGSVERQSESFPGIPIVSRAFLRASRRACCAALRARAACDAFVDVVAGEPILTRVLDDLLVDAPLVHHAGQRGAEALLVGAALVRVDRV